MSVMPVMPREPRAERLFTHQDVDGMPDDGRRYELLDGMLLVSPAPIVTHQRALARLVPLLSAVTPPGVELLFAPLDWRPDELTSLQPDILAFRPEAAAERSITGGLVLAVEVLSPSTRRKDLWLKYSRYQEAGVEEYIVVDPAEPSLVAYRLADGKFVEAGRAVGEEPITLDGAFPATVVPAALVGWPPREPQQP